ncbi:hypothetical protein [Ruegeria arenilitoris]|nr:hypothetical protein [Ruegeria arenilitoris]
MSYSRPFAEGKSSVPRLSLKQIRAELTPDQKELHNRILKLRNTLVAHSDLAMMNFSAQAEPIEVNHDQPLWLVFAQHDEGLQFYKWKDQIAFIDLIQTVFSCLLTTITQIAQADPKAFDINIHFPET